MPARPATTWADLAAQAEAAHQAGDGDRALALARAARRAGPGQAAPAFLLCILLLERGAPEASSLLGMLDGFPGYPAGWERLGRALQPRQPAAARVAFVRAAQGYAALEAEAALSGAAHRMGVALRAAGDLPGARAALERAVARDPSLAAAWFTLGLVCQDQGDAAPAITAFQSALAARPGFHEAAFNLGAALQEARRLDDALDAYAAAWRLRPDSLGRIAQALASPASGRIWLHPGALQRDLFARAGAAGAAAASGGAARPRPARA